MARAKTDDTEVEETMLVISTDNSNVTETCQNDHVINIKISSVHDCRHAGDTLLQRLSMDGIARWACQECK